LCINDPALVERAEIIRDKGTNRRKFYRGEVDKYTWVDHGSSYVPSEVASAFLCAQLEMMDDISSRPESRVGAVSRTPAAAGRRGTLAAPRGSRPSGQTNHHIFYVISPTVIPGTR
jgi:dTDP-4-amino-4,6-dideoxygalactose transaminase